MHIGPPLHCHINLVSSEYWVLSVVAFVIVTGGWEVSSRLWSAVGLKWQSFGLGRPFRLSLVGGIRWIIDGSIRHCAPSHFGVFWTARQTCNALLHRPLFSDCNLCSLLEICHKCCLKLNNNFSVQDSSLERSPGGPESQSCIIFSWNDCGVVWAANSVHTHWKAERSTH